jgi:DNA-binding MarR family transcriptional regulator
MNTLNHHLKNSLTHLMGRTYRAALNRVQKSFSSAGYRITVEQWLLLVNLRNRDGQLHQELADNTYKDKTTVTRLLNGLEKKGLIERAAGTADRRQKRISITGKGKEMLKALGPLALETQSLSLQGIDRGELEICRNVLLKVYGNVNGQQKLFHST